MAEYKNQHFVPKFYFRQFSSDKKSISLYNLKKKKIVYTAPIKNQCQKDYFYEKGKFMERHFNELETYLSDLIRKINTDGGIENLDEYDIYLLHFFVLFQRSRTLAARQQAELASEAMTKKYIELMMRYDSSLPKELTLEDLKRVRITDKGAHIHLFVNHLCAVSLISDLEMILLVNESDEEFIFSDAPVVFHNQYMNRIKSSGNGGFQTPGLQIFFPLNAKHCLFYFDSQMYPFRSHKKKYFLHSRRDIWAINSLQFFNCSENIYFRNEFNGEKISQHHKKLNYAGGSLRGIVFREITSDDDSKLIVSGEENIPYELELSFIKKIPRFRQIPMMRNPDLYQPYVKAVNSLLDEAKVRHEMISLSRTEIRTCIKSVVPSF